MDFITDFKETAHHSQTEKSPDLGFFHILYLNYNLNFSDKRKWNQMNN